MSHLTFLRIARWAKGQRSGAEYPNLETLIDEESIKVSDGYHYARWWAPLTGVFFSLACFLPLALTVHPLFWIGVVGLSVVGVGLGVLFHFLSGGISPAQISLRKQCISLAGKLTSARSLLGVAPVISPEVAAYLDEGAKLYLRSRPNEERNSAPRAADPWSEARSKAQNALDEAMAQLLSLAAPQALAAQEALLAQGWAKPLLEEMQATASVLIHQKNTAHLPGGGLHPAAASLSELSEARAQLERLGTAFKELDDVATLDDMSVEERQKA